MLIVPFTPDLSSVKKQEIMNTRIILLILLAGSPFLLAAQAIYAVNDAAVITIEGTSTMHDWEMETKKVSGKAEFILDGNEVRGIKSLYITVPSESLKSGKGAMDKNAYKALKTNDHREINFTLTDVSKIETSGGKYILTCEGRLTIAGKTKAVELTATCLPKSNGSIQCKGGKVIKMTEYEVEPPSFMFGSVKTGDQLEIEFDVMFSKS